ncbi:MAG: hypothetical protein IKQ60_04480 [Candidatus Methanomethylophilaceae archaeon]|nr:hypothetical protein [Candidatus Methanomethylophilaceae archaeon]
MASTFLSLNGLWSLSTAFMNLYITITVTRPSDSIVTISATAAIPEADDRSPGPVHADSMSENAPLPSAAPAHRASVPARRAARPTAPQSIAADA